VGGKPTVSVTAPAGLTLSTPQTIVSYAGVNVDTVAQRHMQLTSGQRFNLNAGKGISLFSHMDGITQIAHKGKFMMQSQHDDMQVDSAKDIKITAVGRLTIMAKEIVFINTDGAYITLKGGTPEVGGPGALTVKTDGHNWNGPASLSAELPTFGEGDFGRTPRLLRPTDGQPVEGMTLHVEREGDAPITGESDGNGEGPPLLGDRLQQFEAFFSQKR
jgi:type VI secretion system secreted protein VgrG